MKNKLGLGYIVFEDTIEHLEWSIKPIRNLVDYINCVYQTRSFFGNCSKNQIDYLNDLLNRNIIDNIIYAENDLNVHPRTNQLNNRNIGLKDIINKGCTHYLAIDGDEYYVHSEFKEIRDKMFLEGFESSACKMITYYKYLNLILDPPEEFYCPFIYKIKENTLLGNNVRFPVDVDLNRIYHECNFLQITREKLQMHHMSSVRKDLKLKLQNHSSKFQFLHEIEEISNYHDNYKYPDKILFQAKPFCYYDAKIIKPLFENPNFKSI